jgi:CubicO group peptidase (beta-lactamase class C family)
MTDFDTAAREAARIAAAWGAEEPGGAVLVFDRDRLRAEHHGGLALLEQRLPFGPETATRYASISKHFLASLTLRAGLDLDAPLGEGVPGLPPALGAVPLGRALDMTGGLPDVMECLWLLGIPWTASLDRAALFRFVASLDSLNYGPGAEMSYSNTGYRLAETLLERREMPLFAALHERFLAPLGLGIRFPTDETEPVPGLAAGYWRAAEGGWRRGRYGLHFSGSGGLAGTARDLARWLRALLADEAPASGLLAALAAPRRMAGGTESFYGLGLARLRLGATDLVGHGGSLPGYKNHFLLAPEHGAGVLVVSNREDTDPLAAALGVMAALLGQAPPPRAPDGALPEGLFVEADGPAWIEIAGGTACFLGATEPLHADGAGGARTLPAYLPLALRREGDGIAGRVGQAARRFRLVPADAALDAGLAGAWRCEAQGAALTVADGHALLGAGPARERLPLKPLGGGRALVERAHGPWRQRALLWLREPGTLRLVTHRSRVLDFRRA